MSLVKSPPRIPCEMFLLGRFEVPEDVVELGQRFEEAGIRRMGPDFEISQFSHRPRPCRRELALIPCKHNMDCAWFRRFLKLHEQFSVAKIDWLLNVLVKKDLEDTVRQYNLCVLDAVFDAFQQERIPVVPKDRSVFDIELAYTNEKFEPESAVLLTKRV